MELIISLIISVAFAVAFKAPLKKAPWVFYLIAVAICAVFCSQIMFKYTPDLAITLYPYMQRGLIGFGLIVVVMFIGVFPTGSAPRKYLMPIRGELSIVACILIIGHVVNYFVSYFGRFLEGFAGLQMNEIASFVVSFILVLLLAVLTVTSFNFVRKSMKSSTWKKIQIWAYPFFALTYLHIILILVTPNFSVDSKAFLAVVVYTVIMVAYVVLRVMQYRRSKAAGVLPEQEDTLVEGA